MQRAFARACFTTLVVLLMGLTGCSERESIHRQGHPNVFVLVVDGIPADAIGDDAGVWPSIEALAAEGARFESSLLPSMDAVSNRTTLLISQPPERHGVRGSDAVLQEEELTLAEVFAQRGFATAALSDIDVLETPRGLTQGFESVETNGSLTSAVADWLEGWKREAEKRAFLLYVHTKVRGTPAETDGRIDDLVRLVRSVEGPNQTVIAMTSTQTPRMNATRIPQEEDTGVPLVFRFPPRLAPGAVHADDARAMDLGPTLMMLAKVRRPERYGFPHTAYSFAMRDLVEVLVGIPRGIPMTVTGEGMVNGERVRWMRLREYRIVRRTASDGTVHHTLYQTSEDPEETTDLTASDPLRSTTYAKKLDAWLGICERWAPASSDVP